MRHLEKFSTVKSSDIENWDPQQILNKEKNIKQYTGTKDLNLKLGLEVQNLFDEYGLHVDVGPGDWLKRQGIVLKSEEKFKEYRVHLSKILPWEDFLESEGISEEEFDELSEKEKEKLQDEYHSSKIDHDSNMEFSVFLPLGTKNLIEAALADASVYLKMLSKCLPEIFKCNTIDDSLRDETDGFKCFLNSKELKITNDNIEDVPMINYRIYKDSKFFVELEENLENDTMNFINDWLKLIK